MTPHDDGDVMTRVPKMTIMTMMAMMMVLLVPLVLSLQSERGPNTTGWLGKT